MPTCLTSADSIGLVSIQDATTGQDLVCEPRPLCVSLDSHAKSASIRIQNSPQSTLQLRLSTDQPWLTVANRELTLPPAGCADLTVQVAPTDPGDFAVLRLGWQIDGEEFAEHVLIQRRQSLPKPPPPSASTAAATPIPDWMR